MKKLCFTAFDHRITHFDLANNYGPEPGSAEKHFGLILKEHLFAYRDELLISTKAGYDMWKGPYGNWGQPQVPDCQPGSEPATTGTRLCRYFFLSCRKEVPPVISVDREGFFVCSCIINVQDLQIYTPFQIIDLNGSTKETFGMRDIEQTFN